jgi:hypothetical protein
MTTLSITLRNNRSRRFDVVAAYIRDLVNNSPELWETLDACLVFGNRDKLGRGGHIHLTNCPVEVVDWLRRMLEVSAWRLRESWQDNWGEAYLDWAYDLEEALARAADEEGRA